MQLPYSASREDRGGAELVDTDDSRIDYSLYAGAASRCYVRKWCSL